MLTLRHREIITGLLAPGLALLAFGLGEGALRIVSVAKFGTVETVEKTAIYAHDPKTDLRLPLPGARLGVIQFNARGFRGPDLEPLPPPDTLRVAFVGSSTTFDGGIVEAQTWAAQTTGNIALALPQGCRVEYLNAGLPAFGMQQIIRYFKARIAELEPHVVIVLPGDVTNDNTNMLRERGLDKTDIIAPSWFARRSVLWGKIEMNLKIIALQRAARRGTHFVDFDEEHYADIFAARLAALLHAVRDAGALPAAVTITGRSRETQTPEERFDAAMTLLYYNPFTSIDNLIAAQLAYNGKIRAVAAALDIPVVDEPYEIPADEHHFTDSTHFTPVGSAAQGRRVAHALLGSPAFRRTVHSIGGACAAYEAPGR